MYNKSKEEVQDIFTSIAGRYDALNSILSLNIDRMWRKKTIRLLGIRENQKVLDLCCGTGQMVYLECMAGGENTEVTGLDLTEEMLRVGRLKLDKPLRGYKYELVQGNALELPFEDNTFDYITIAFGLRNIPDKPKALSEMLRVLKPGGRAACLEINRPDVPVLKNIYGLYFNHALPFIGYLGTGDKKAYLHLRDSVNAFMSKSQLKTEFDRAGFKDTGYVSLTLGAAAIHYGTKGLK